MTACRPRHHLLAYRSRLRTFGRLKEYLLRRTHPQRAALAMERGPLRCLRFYSSVPTEVWAHACL